MKFQELLAQSYDELIVHTNVKLKHKRKCILLINMHEVDINRLRSTSTTNGSESLQALVQPIPYGLFGHLLFN